MEVGSVSSGVFPSGGNSPNQVRSNPPESQPPRQIQPPQGATPPEQLRAENTPPRPTVNANGQVVGTQINTTA